MASKQAKPALLFGIEVALANPIEFAAPPQNVVATIING